jgi:hypothetical protein
MVVKSTSQFQSFFHADGMLRHSHSRTAEYRHYMYL